VEEGHRASQCRPGRLHSRDTFRRPSACRTMCPGDPDLIDRTLIYSRGRLWTVGHSQLCFAPTSPLFTDSFERQAHLTGLASDGWYRPSKSRRSSLRAGAGHDHFAKFFGVLVGPRPHLPDNQGDAVEFRHWEVSSDPSAAFIARISFRTFGEVSGSSSHAEHAKVFFRPIKTDASARKRTCSAVMPSISPGRQEHSEAYVVHTHHNIGSK
jgi:hypothetical protein